MHLWFLVVSGQGKGVLIAELERGEITVFVQPDIVLPLQVYQRLYLSTF
jgi:hypothetical protein